MRPNHNTRIIIDAYTWGRVFAVNKKLRQDYHPQNFSVFPRLPTPDLFPRRYFFVEDSCLFFFFLGINAWILFFSNTMPCSFGSAVRGTAWAIGHHVPGPILVGKTGLICCLWSGKFEAQEPVWWLLDLFCLLWFHYHGFLVDSFLQWSWVQYRTYSCFLFLSNLCLFPQRFCIPLEHLLSLVSDYLLCLLVWYRASFGGVLRSWAHLFFLILFLDFGVSLLYNC